MKKLVVFPQGAFFRGANGLRTVDAFFSQTRELTRYFDRIRVCTRVVDDPGGDCPVDGVEVAALPPYASRLDFVRMAPRYRRLILEAVGDADLGLVVLPGYVGSLASLTCRRRGLPIVHFVVGRWGRVVLSRRPGGADRFRAWIIAPLLDRFVERLTRETLTFHNTALPPDAPPHHHVRVSSTYSTTDLTARTRPDARADEIRVLFAGRFAAEKGIPHLLGAVAELRATGSPAVLDLVGDGEQRGALEREARRLGIADAVRFSGWVRRGPDLWRHFDGADIFVLPSLEDMAPRVVLEAMARRLPVVASAVGHVGELVRDGETGILVEPGSSAEIAQAIRRLWVDPDLRRRIADRGGEVAAGHTLEAETGRTVEIIRRHFESAGEAGR